MSDDLHRYYEEELGFFRQEAAEFARKHPKIAGRLELDESSATASRDPHIERLIEAFSLLTARVRRKIDDEFPEIVESLLELLYPHYLRPVPPMAIAQFRFQDQQAPPADAASIPVGTSLHSRAADGIECTFRTAYPANVWPLRVAGSAFGSVGSVQAVGVPSDVRYALRIQIETLGGIPLASLKIPSLRFFLNGDTTAHYLLYELLFAHAAQVQLRPRGQAADPLILPADAIRPVGFESDEGLLPYSDRSFLGYRLLQEYFHFPQKFFFFDLTGLELQPLDRLGNAFEILVLFRDSELRDRMASVTQAVDAETFQLGCTPIVNLFERPAETIRVSHAVTEYHVIPDRHRRTSCEVYSVDRVTSMASYAEQEQEYQPFYSFRHAYQDQQQHCFWLAHRRPSLQKDDDGSEVYLSLVDLNFQPSNPADELLTPRVTCTNRDYVSRLDWRREFGELEGEGLPLVHVRCLVAPTKTFRPPLHGSLQWRLISHLSLNHLSLEQVGGREALQEILRLYMFNEDEDARKRIAAITSLKSASSVSRVLFDTGVAFCRGVDVDIEFNEEQFSGSGIYLFAAVLERFLSLYSSVNSYSRLTARSRQRRVQLKRWPARVGSQRLL